MSDNGLLLQAVACRNAKLSEFARTIQAKNNNNQSRIKLLIVVAVISIPRNINHFIFKL